MKKKKDDSICLVNPPKNWTKPPMFNLVARGLNAPCVIPFKAEVSAKGYNDVIGKVKGKALIQLIFTVPTVRLRYKKREWTEDTQFYLLLPIRVANKIASKLLRLTEKHLESDVS